MSNDQEKSIQQLVVEDIQERERYGIKHHGRAVYLDTPNDPDEGDPLRQAYHEAMDLLIYLRWQIERDEVRNQRLAKTISDEKQRLQSMVRGDYDWDME